MSRRAGFGPIIGELLLFRKLLHDLYIAFIKTLVRFMPGSQYMLFAGSGSATQLCRYIARSGVTKLLVVSDKPLVELGVVDKAISGLAGSRTEVVVFSDVQPDPSYEVVAAGAAMYREQACDSILAVGGGSSIDAAKIIGVAVSCDGDPKDYVGFGKVKDDLPPLYALPTTSGTGSEATSGAVITDTSTNEKGIISGNQLLPIAACLDPELLVGLPPHITAATGMDALTHAIEAYIGVWDRGDSMVRAASAVELIFAHLRTAYESGSSLEAREALALASYQAGQAINQVNVGNVHAIAHQIGAIYHVPHGLANAVLLPGVLECSLEDCRERLTDLAKLIGKQTAEEFIVAVRELNDSVGIPTTFEALRQSDFAEIILRARKEAFNYPSPHFMSEEDIQQILSRVLPQ